MLATVVYLFLKVMIKVLQRCYDFNVLLFQMVTKHILIELNKIQDELGVRGTCPKTSGARLASALSIIHIAKIYFIKLNRDSVSLLCRALSLKPDYGKRTCEDYDQLLLHFPTLIGE